MLYYGHSYGSFPNETSITPYPDTADEYRSAVRAGEYRTHTSGVEEPLSEGDMQTAHTPPFITSCNQLHHCCMCEIPVHIIHRNDNSPVHGAVPFQTAQYHLLEDHTVLWAKNTKVGFGLLGEQGAESIHARLNLPALIIKRTIQYMTSLVPRPTLTAADGLHHREG